MNKTSLPKTSEPANRALALVGIEYLEDLTKFTEKELLKLHGFGPKALRILKAALQEKGLSFAKEK